MWRLRNWIRQRQTQRRLTCEANRLATVIILTEDFEVFKRNLYRLTDLSKFAEETDVAIWEATRERV